MKTILCYGDSNTWGWNPAKKERFASTERWTGILRRFLGDGFTVIEEGLNGRTTVWDDPIEGYKNGEKYLVPCLETHRPLDLVIIMLGTNDLKKRFSLSAFDIAAGVEKLLKIIQNSNAGLNDGSPEILLMSPAPVGTLTEFAEMFEGAEEKSKRLVSHYAAIANEYGCHFLDAATLVKTSEYDGIHLDASEHQKLGNQVGKIVKEIYNK